VFDECESLTSINVDKNNRRYVDIDGVLFNKNMTTLIKFPEGKKCSNYIIPDGVTEFGNDTFYHVESLKSVTIPGSMTSIEIGTFQGCQFNSLTSVTILDGVTKIDEAAFSYCASLPDVIIPDSVKAISFESFTECNSLSDATKQRIQEIMDNNKLIHLGGKNE
jgi:hypothetical protein